MNVAHESINFTNVYISKGGGVRALLTFADKGEKWVNNNNKSAYIILERPLIDGFN